MPHRNLGERACADSKVRGWGKGGAESRSSFPADFKMSEHQLLPVPGGQMFCLRPAGCRASENLVRSCTVEGGAQCILVVDITMVGSNGRTRASNQSAVHEITRRYLHVRSFLPCRDMTIVLESRVYPLNFSLLEIVVICDWNSGAIVLVLDGEAVMTICVSRPRSGANVRFAASVEKSTYLRLRTRMRMGREFHILNHCVGGL